MKRIGMAIIFSFTLMLSACWGDDERPKELRIGYASSAELPVVLFVRFHNAALGNSETSIGQFRNSGWDRPEGNRKITPRYFEDKERAHLLQFNVIWHEVVSGKNFTASLEGDARELHRSWINSDVGEIALRVGPGGEVQLVSAVTFSDPSKGSVKIVAKTCGTLIDLTEFQRGEIKRVTQDVPHLAQQIAEGAKLSSVCGGN